MSDADKTVQTDRTGNVFAFLLQHKSWWLLPLIVLVFALLLIYVLVHLSAADSEMYPTSQHTVVLESLWC